MKYTISLIALAAAVSAQSITDIPPCALECVANGVTGIGCGLTDFKCSCSKADQLTPAVTPCVQQACPNTADQQKVITVLSGICEAAGVPINIPQPGASSSAPVPSSAAPTVQTSVPTAAPTPSATDKVISSASAIPAPPASDVCVVVTVTETVTGKPSVAPPYPTAPVGTGMPKPIPSGTGAYTPPPQFTGAAAALNVPAGIAGLAGLAAFLL